MLEMLGEAEVADSLEAAPRQSLEVDLLTRRSVSPRRLCSPGPTAVQLAFMVEAALRAPDHGRLQPWRLIEFPIAERDALAVLFAAEKLRRSPDANAVDVARAKEHATGAPTLLGFVVCSQPEAVATVHEQWLSAGAALNNLLLAAHGMKFGAMVLSGDRCRDAALASALGVSSGECLAGFVSIGTVTKPSKALSKTVKAGTLQVWTGR